ncbi:hypothetical protein SprV_0401451400 [Sparganum proliferum]
MLMDAYSNERPEIHIAYRTDRYINNRRMKATTRLSTTTVHDQHVTDDCALNTTTELDKQRSMDYFAAGCANFGLIINKDRTVVMYQPSPNVEYNSPPVTVNGNQLKTVDNFAYSGSMLSRNTNIDDGVARRLSKANQAFGRLQLNTELKMYNAVVLTTILYGAETWIVYPRKPNHFHLSCLRRILKPMWQGRIPDREVLEQIGIRSIHAMPR